MNSESKQNPQPCGSYPTIQLKQNEQMENTYDKDNTYKDCKTCGVPP